VSIVGFAVLAWACATLYAFAAGVTLGIFEDRIANRAALALLVALWPVLLLLAGGAAAAYGFELASRRHRRKAEPPADQPTRTWRGRIIGTYRADVGDHMRALERIRSTAVTVPTRRAEGS
jgi:cation transporter-like permease